MDGRKGKMRVITRVGRGELREKTTLEGRHGKFMSFRSIRVKMCWLGGARQEVVSSPDQTSQEVTGTIGFISEHG